MPVDVESELARLGTAWSESVAHVDVAEVLERAMATRSEPSADIVGPPPTRRLGVRAEPPAPRSGQRWLAAAACAAFVVAGVVALAQRRDGGPEPATTIAATTPSSMPIDSAAPLPPPEPFVGVWSATDTDGSSQTMDIVRSGTDDYEVVLHDDAATNACAGAAATIIGTGNLATDATLLIPQPVLTCDDGSIPSVGPPPQADIANLTFDLDPVADEITDNFGVVWRREGSNNEPTAPPPVTVPPSNIVPSAVTVPALAPATSGGMWPQSTLEEVRAAQELADAGDPAYTWQLDAKLAAGETWGAGTEIFALFIEEGLGWEKYVSDESMGGAGFERVVYIRCAPGQTNPLYAGAPPEIRGCAPTIDELTYETVSLSVTQPERRGLSGIWVVDRWDMLQSRSEPGSLWELLFPVFGQSQVEQVAPPSDAEVTALLEAFLRARVDGAGAEQYLLREPEESTFEDTEVPILYATTSGAPYERSEIHRLQGPVWPNGWMEYKVQLFAQGDTVVEQYFHVVRRDGQLGLVYGHASTGVDTTENGQYVAVPHSNEFGGTLSFTAPPLVPRGDGRTEIALAVGSDARVVIGEDPRPDSPDRQGCWSGTAPAPAADATELARNIQADPDFETTAPVPVSIAEIDGLQMDVTFSEPDLCYWLWSYTRGDAGGPPWRMRLYMVDYPESAWPSGTTWRPQVLTIAVIAPHADFERALEQATPIVESLEFHPA